MKKLVKKAFCALAVTLTLGVPSAVVAKATIQDSQNQTTEQAFAPVAVLKTGSRGAEVKEVQRRLKNWGYYSGSVDGVFGAGTRAAVIRFQQKNGLKADGVVGKATYQALGINASYNTVTTQSSVGGFSDSE